MDQAQSTVPLVLLQHSRGILYNWDPALIDALASTRQVVTFDNAGVGCSTGTAPDTIEQMASEPPSRPGTPGTSLRRPPTNRKETPRPTCRHRVESLEDSVALLTVGATRHG